MVTDEPGISLVDILRKASVDAFLFGALILPTQTSVFWTAVRACVDEWISFVHIYVLAIRKGSQARVFDNDKLFNFTPRWIYKSNVHTYLSKQHSFICLSVPSSSSPCAKRLPNSFFVLKNHIDLWPAAYNDMAKHVSWNICLRTAKTLVTARWTFTMAIFITLWRPCSYGTKRHYCTQISMELSERGNYWLWFNLWRCMQAG